MSHAFFHVLSVHEVITRLQAIPPLPVETCPLDSPTGLEGRVLSADVLAKDDVPLRSRSGMDGYAVCAADTFGASEGHPAYLQCVGHSPVNTPPTFCLQSGQCAGIVTGGIVPEGADAVIMVEYTHDMGAECVEIRRAVPPGEHIMVQGEDARTGQCVLPAGTLLRPQEIGLLAAVGSVSVPVHARPVVGILSTGDEVIPASQTPHIGQVRDVNSHTLASLVRRAGGLPLALGIVPDTLDALEAALQHGIAKTQVLLLSGGSSVGVRDLTVAALQGIHNTEIFCHGVALSPGKPLILARAGGCTVWGLPGQVTSAQVVMMILGQPFLRHLAGQKQPFAQEHWTSCRAELARNVASRQGREDYVRIRLQQRENAPPLAHPVLGMSGLLRTLVDSQGLVRIAAQREGLEQGCMVDVLLFE